MNRLLLTTLGLLVATSAAAEDWQSERLPWGDPDLQGIWTTATISQLARPEELEDEGLVISEAMATRIETGGNLVELLDSVDDVGEGDLQAGEDVGGYNRAWLDPGTRVLRVNGEPRSSIISHPEDGQVPYTLWGRAQFYWNGFKMMTRHDDPEARPLGERCTVGFGSTGGPPMLPVVYNNNYQFVQTPDQVLILVEMNHNVRTIRMDAEPLPYTIKPWLGDSHGHWEGDTLVVRTSQFHPQQRIRLAIKHQVFMSVDTVVEERFTRTARDEILYQFTVSDDSLYKEDWQGEMTMRSSEGPIYEYACHEGNYALPNILTGARAEERGEES